jgi:hypothetical protein
MVTESTQVEVPAETLMPDCTNGVICHSCQAEVKKALGHDEVKHKGKAPTCTEGGWDEYVTCSRCNYTTYVPKAALGHDRVSHAAKNATCTEIGWQEYVTCSRCDFTTYKEIKAKGHTNGAEATCTEAQTCTVCGAELNAALGHDMIIDEKVPTGQMNQIYLLGGLMLLCAALGLGGNVLANRMSAYSAGRVTRKLRHDLFAKLECLSARQMDQLTTSSAVSRLCPLETAPFRNSSRRCSISFAFFFEMALRSTSALPSEKPATVSAVRIACS